jgi:hypothetical protein
MVTLQNEKNSLAFSRREEIPMFKLEVLISKWLRCIIAA